MKKDLIVALALIFPLCTTLAQDPAQSPKWQTIFANASRPEYITFTFDDFDKKFYRGEFYDGLIIFKDSTKQSLELTIRYDGIANLCDPRKPIKGQNLSIPQSYEISKKEILYFVFSDLVFGLDMVRKNYKSSLTPSAWSVLLIDGPIRFTKYYEISTSGSTPLDLAIGRLQKGEEDIGSDPLNLGGFGFKKFAAKTFADYKELADKIAAEQEGYKRKDGVKIIMEYNAWVAQQNPDAFRASLLLQKFLATNTGN